MTTYETTSDTPIETGLDFLLGHFQEPIWPRTISTRTTEGRQTRVYDKEETLARFKQANLLDCRINAYPYREDWAIELLGQTPNFIFIDEDKSNFDSRRALDVALCRTLKNMKEKLENNSTQPTVLWSGSGGYHILQPVGGLILGQESMFADLARDPDTEFLRFAESYLSSNKSDQMHKPSFKSCMLRVPGSYNSKLVSCNDKGECVTPNQCERQVRIIQKWNGVRPSIKPLLPEFFISLADAKIKSINSIKSKGNRQKKTTSRSWGWIEELLHKPLPDFRKLVTHYVLSRYLVNVRQLTHDEAYSVIMDWLTRCNEIECLRPTLRDFGKRVIYDVKEAARNQKLPVGMDLLRDMNKELYVLLFGNRIPT